MIRKGYDVILYFLCTDYVEDIHINRVQKRVKEGGHDVPPGIIEHRYKMSLTYLRSKLHLFREAYLIDNAETAVPMAFLEQGKIVMKKPECPAWVQQTLFILERLQNKNQ